MIALGGDVGSGMTGLTVLDGRVFLYRDAVPPDEVIDALRFILDRFMVERVGIETMSQVFEYGKGAKDPKIRRSIEKALLASRDVAGKLRGVIEVLRPDVLVRGEQAHIIQSELSKLMEDVQRLDARAQQLGSHFDQARKDVDQIRTSAGKILKRGEEIENIPLEPPASGGLNEVSPDSRAPLLKQVIS